MKLLRTFPLLVAWWAFHYSLFAQPGITDPSFGINGTVIIPGALQHNYATTQLILADGSILVAVFSGTGVVDLTDGSTSVFKLLPDGSFSPDFTLQNFDLAPGAEFIYKMNVLPDSKILLAGVLNEPDFSFDILITRLLPNGQPDPTFGENGIVTTDMGFNNVFFSDALFLPDGKMLICGNLQNIGEDPHYFLARFHPDGMLDAAFGADGLVVSNMFSSLDRIALLPDGKILCAGITGDWDNHSVLIAQFFENGTIVPDFGDNGHEIYASASGEILLKTLLLLPDGRFYVHDTDGISRRFPDGSPDPSFGLDGFKESYSDNGFVLLPNEKLLGWGNGPNPSDFNLNIWLEQLNADGQPDAVFADNGVIKTDSRGECSSGLLGPDGKLLICGARVLMDNQGQVYSQPALFRFLTDFSVGVFNAVEPENSILVYPNPVRTQAGFSFELTKPVPLSLRLVNMDGRTVQHFFSARDFPAGQITENLLFSPELPPGNYILLLEGQGKTVSTNIVLEK